MGAAPRNVARVLKGTVVAALVGAAVLVGGGPSVGAPAQNSPQTFNFTGTAQTFTVPADVCQVTLDVFGAEGGTG